MRTGLFLFLFAAVKAADSGIGQNPKHNGPHSGEYDKAAVASEHPKCSEIGKQILIAQGNAVDSAIATLLCIGVINNFSSGIGGGGFMLVHTPNEGDHAFDFRETAPAAASQDMFNSAPIDAKLGGRAVAVPGEISGFAAAHVRFGRLSWSELFMPNIKLAREGFIVSEKLSAIITKFKSSLWQSKAMRTTYFRPDGQPKQPGDTIVRPELAATLERIAADPERSKVFYQGSIADDLVKAVKDAGGILTKEDMAAYQTHQTPALESNYRGYKLLTTNAPSAGPVLIEALNILSHFNVQEMATNERNQLLVETLKFAYGSRMRLGDPAFEPEMINELSRMLDTYRAAQIVPLIDLHHTHEPEYYSSTLEKVHDHGTTHVSVIDAEGMGVSSTCTVNLEFGAKLMDPVTGIILNNEMDDFSIPNHSNQFSLPPSPSNYIKPGKRPMSSSTPVIMLRDERIQLIVGGTGGSRIISSTLLTIVKMIDLGVSAVAAVDAPRIHHQLIPNYLIAEYEVPEAEIKDLTARGHEVHVFKEGFSFSSVQAIKRDPFTGTLIAAADGRKGGGTDGY